MPQPSATSAYASPNPIRLPRVVKAVRTRAEMVPVVIQQRALHTTAKYLELARQKFNRNFPMPDVAFDLRGRTAGQAFYTKNLIRYNAVLLVENIADFESDTIPHEVAHLIARQVFGLDIASHGDEWKRVMRVFGVDPSRCHNYDITNSAVGGVHEYTCNCGKKFPLSTRRSKTARAGRLTCRTCKSVLRPVGSPAPAAVPMPMHPAVRQAPTPSRAPSRPPVPVARSAPLRTPAPAPKLPSTPYRPPTPVAGSSRPATPPMLQFALTIAHKLGIALQAENTVSFEACADFINRFKNTEGVGGAGIRPPSEKQLQFAHDLARRKGLLLGADVLCDANRMSAWLTANR